MAFSIEVNPQAYVVDVDGYAPLGVARCIGHDRYEIRVRHGAVRRLHRASLSRRHPKVDPLTANSRSPGKGWGE